MVMHGDFQCFEVRYPRAANTIHMPIPSSVPRSVQHTNHFKIMRLRAGVSLKKWGTENYAPIFPLTCRIGTEKKL
jgi:hypothetical protein